MSNFQFLDYAHVLHYARKGFLSIQVECLCGWKIEGRINKEKQLQSEVERHIRMVLGPESEILPTADDIR